MHYLDTYFSLLLRMLIISLGCGAKSLEYGPR